MTNGFSCEYLNVTRGIQQGNAMSALLYMSQSEPLAQRLRACAEIERISVTINDKTTEYRVCQYVDDTVHI